MHIILVAHCVDKGILTTTLLDEVNPGANVLEGLSIGEVNDEQSSMTVSQIAGYKTSKALLSSSVPQLQPQRFAEDY